MNDIFPLVFETPEPFRLRVQKSLTAALEQITPANGFYSDMSPGTEPDGDGGTLVVEKILRGRGIFGDNDPLPMISILEEPIAPENDMAPSDGTTGLSSYDLMVQGFVKDDHTHPTDNAHYLLGDVKRRLITLKEEERRDDRVFRFGAKANTVTEVSFGNGVVRPADEISAVAYFWLRVSFELCEDHLDPFR